MTKLNKEYWENRYQNLETNWDIGTISTPLKEYIDQLTNKSLKILIPGAGNGHEFDYLISKGFENTFVIDIAPTPLNNIRKRNGKFQNQLLQGDFFEHDEQYDLIIEQTFFCALNPQLRQQYVNKMHQLLHPNGKIAGLLFNFPLTTSGPPFGGNQKIYIDLFENEFIIKTLETATNSIQPRKDRELFFIFEKK